MGQIKDTHWRYREKDQMLDDLVKVLKLDMHNGTKFAVLHDITWVWTEFSGKYIGCPYWSIKAHDFFLQKSWPKMDDQELAKYFRHDHVVPRKLIINHILDNKVTDRIKIQSLFDRYLIGCVVLISENKNLDQGTRSSMPNKEVITIENVDSLDPWLRYKNKDIEYKRVYW